MDQSSQPSVSSCKLSEHPRSREPAESPCWPQPICRCALCGKRGRPGPVSGKVMQIEFHQLELRYEGLRRTSPEVEKRLLASVASAGQQSTVVVVRAEQSQRYILIDGYKRVRVLRRLGQDTVRASLWEIQELDALIVNHPCSKADVGWIAVRVTVVP